VRTAAARFGAARFGAARFGAVFVDEEGLLFRFTATFFFFIA